MGMLPVSYLAKKILKIMAVDYCDRQLTQRLGWAAPAYHIREGATLHPGACNLSLQYDGRPYERFGMWNMGSLSGKGEKFVKN